MTNNKRTIKDYLTALRDAVGDADMMFGDITQDEMLNFLDGRIAQVERKASKSGKVTELQQANIELQSTIYDCLATVEEPITVGYMLKNFECCSGLSPQKVTPRMTSLVKEGLVVSTKIKGQMHYSIA